MTRLFVTATGTDIGKTFVTALLCRQLRAKGIAVRALKPVLSGYDPADAAECDSGVILAALGKTVTEDAVAAMTPWRFAAPLSPDMAAAREGREIDFEALAQFCRDEGPETLLIEGVGGAMVPLTVTHTVLDWIAALDMPALVVAGSYLGTISHTLTTVAAIRGRGIAVAGVIVSESESNPVPLPETVRTIARFLPNTAILAVPRGVDDAAMPDLTGFVQS
jgi:dethiobiotin synthetase